MFEDCLKCGQCQKSCYLSKMNIRSFVEELLKGEGKDNLWICSNCWVCQDNCPQKLPLMEYKWEQQRQTKPPKAMQFGFEYIRREGYCFPIRENDVNGMRAYEELELIIFAPVDILQALLPSVV